MKTFSVAVAVAVVLAFICIQESSAFPFAGVKELEEPMSNNEPAAAENEEMSVASGKMLLNIREKRQIKSLRCLHCCTTSPGGAPICSICCT